jgi:hypothetical protein
MADEDHRSHEEEIAALRAERDVLAAKAREADARAAEAQAQAQQRAVETDLRSAATAAGIVDLDALLMMDRSKIELDAAGNLKNGTELMAALKEAKPFLFQSRRYFSDASSA